MAVVVADQATKSWALEALADGPVHLVWTLRLRLVFNSGAAFSFGQGSTPWLTAAAAAVLVVLLGLARSVATTRAAVGLGLVAGGAVGNLVDRLVRGHGGAVVDFVDLQWWPVFNVADAAITVGAVVLVLSGGLGRSPEAGRDRGRGAP